jgi:hypothetical protein
VGTVVTVTGTALGVRTVYDVTFTDPVTAEVFVVGTAASNSTGSMTAVITIPASTAGAGGIGIVPAAAPGVTFNVTVGTVAVAVADALIGIAGKYTIVWTFDAPMQEWLVFDTALGAPSTLVSMTRGQGYWILVTEDVTLLYGGNSYTLLAGWNLIGWLG